MHLVTTENHNIREVSSELEARLRGFNEASAGPLRSRPVALTVRDDSGRLIGGLTAEIFWNTLYIDILWVDAEYRGQGYGTLLLQEAESKALADSCEVVYLSTFDFQAPGFYARHGYRAFGELQDVPRGSRRRWFCKRVGGDAEGQSLKPKA
jgi:GNAT superfamily N-acetyltransferase